MLTFGRFMIGKCQNCSMVGVVARKAMIRPSDCDAISGYAAEDGVDKLLVCATCFETPSGVESDNVAHKRLPESEYVKLGSP